MTFESFLEQDDPVLLAYEKFADTFGLLVTLTIAFTFVSEVLLGPALLSQADRWHALGDRPSS